MTKAQEIVKKIQEGTVTGTERCWLNEFLRLHMDIENTEARIHAFNLGIYLSYRKQDEVDKLEQLKKDLTEHLKNGDKITS